MLTILGYIPAFWLALAGSMGLSTGYIPLFTRAPTRTFRVRCVSILLMLPLPLAIWLGYRPPESMSALDEDRRLAQLQHDLVNESVDLNDQLLQLLQRSLDVSETTTNRAALAELRHSQLQAEQRRDELAEALRQKHYREPLELGRAELVESIQNLEAYRLLFDRWFFIGMALVFAIGILSGGQGHGSPPLRDEEQTLRTSPSSE